MTVKARSAGSVSPSARSITVRNSISRRFVAGYSVQSSTAQNSAAMLLLLGPPLQPLRQGEREAAAGGAHLPGDLKRDLRAALETRAALRHPVPNELGEQLAHVAARLPIRRRNPLDAGGIRRALEGGRS